MNARAVVAFVLAFLWSGAAPAAPVLQVEGGVLTGARGVSVNGELYDVEFRDGTCIELFSGCDSLSDFTFTDSRAIAASQALLDQVFVDGVLGNFDSMPALTRGCGDNTGQGFCAVFTPVDPLVNNVLAQNSSIEVGDLVRFAFTLPSEDLRIYDTTVYAVWTVHTPAIPEASTAALLISGIAALLVLGSRHTRNSVH
jgi:hypothetical protein